MSGDMQQSNLLVHGVFTFEDRYKGGCRLNIDGHGKLRNKVGVLLNGVGIELTALELANILRTQYDMSRYVCVRTIICYSGNGGNKSFGYQLSQLLVIPVKSYKGPVHASHSNLAIGIEKMLKNGLSIQEIQVGVANGGEYKVSKRNPYSMISNFRDWKDFRYKPVHYNFHTTK